MSTEKIWALVLSRVSLGWLFFYAGITKVLNPEWSAAGYLQSAKTFSFFYEWLATPSILPYINVVNQWLLLLIGISLILGLFVRYFSYAGVALMILYYFPVLSFPKVGTHSFLIDEHLIYALVFILLIVFKAGNYYGLDQKLAKRTK